MASRSFHTFIIIQLILLASSVAAGPGRERVIDQRLLSNGCAGSPLKVWIFFERDNNSLSSDKMELSGRALERMRIRSGISRAEYELDNIPGEYISGIVPHIIRLRHVSSYFYAVSAEIEPAGLDGLSYLDYVKRIKPVEAFRRSVNRGSRVAVFPFSRNEALYGRYGESLEQLELIQAADLLERRVNGSGEKGAGIPVRVCMLDTGYDLEHEAFQSINIIAQRDFVQNDSITSNQPGDSPSQDRHGTLVLGAIAGYREGRLIGPAWGAEYLLGKTEIRDQEIIIEEDNWVAGLEWADSAGADIVSSSLGYMEWYTRQDMNGRTALCTRAAARAAERGILVVNAVGNEGFGGDTTLIAPSDADSIIAVGAVYSSGNIAYNSSRGPSADGRIKPEVVAMGVDVFSVDPGNYSGYALFSGTSLATPLVAGVCAQIMEVNPYLSVMEIRDRIINTATRSSNPDNIYGYGLVRGLAASGLEPERLPREITLKLLGNNPFRDNIGFELFTPEWSEISVNVYDSGGRLIRTLIDYRLIKYGERLNWDGRSDSGTRVNAGVYFLSVSGNGNIVINRKIVFIP